MQQPGSTLFAIFDVGQNLIVLYLGNLCSSKVRLQERVTNLLGLLYSLEELLEELIIYALMD
jgi:hypothetical protein